MQWNLSTMDLEMAFADLSAGWGLTHLNLYWIRIHKIGSGHYLFLKGYNNADVRLHDISLIIAGTETIDKHQA